MRFYCPAMINFDFAEGIVSHFQGSLLASASFPATAVPTAQTRAEAIAATARAIADLHITAENARILTQATLDSLTGSIAAAMKPNNAGQ